MGYYVNPTDGRSKEEWLRDESFAESREESFAMCKEYDIDDCWFVCLFDNGPFTAGLIMYSQEEFDCIKGALERDRRPKKFYLVEKKKLEQFCD